MAIEISLEKVKELRKRKGITQEEMAEKLGYKGKSGYCQLEKGEVRMTLEKAQMIADILGEDVNIIFFQNKVHANGTEQKPKVS